MRLRMRIDSLLKGKSSSWIFGKRKQRRNSMKTIIYAILYVIVTPFWWFVMQIDNALSKLYMHISIKFLESRMKSNDNNE